MLLLEFLKYKKLIDKEIKKDILAMGEKGLLRDACEYALLSGGKRFRPIIVLMIAKLLGKNFPALQAALSVEYFHTASLIADDLPCMDDEIERRKKASTHKKFGEATAVLASYTLIAKAYEMIGKNAEKLKEIGYEHSEKVCLEALKVISKCAGIEGATQGQFLDLYPPNFSIETLMKIIHQKTVTLFEVSFVLGWLFGGGELEKLKKVKECSHFFGRAFQIADDIEDMKEDLEKGKKINIANTIGEDNAKKLLTENIEGCKALLEDLSLFNSSFKEALLLIERRNAMSII